MANAQQNKNIYTYKLGDFEVSLLSESQSQGKKDILIGATEDMIKEYIPNGTFPNAVNAFLIKTPDKNILIDSGFGTKLFDNLELLGVNSEEIDIILITHMHGDHISGMLKNGNSTFPNAKVYLSHYEYDYWMNNELMNSLPENKRGSFKIPREVINIYNKQLHLFTPNDLNESFSGLFPGITGINAHGHTPGHTMYMIESNGKQILVWGDLAHAMDIQMPYPHIAVTYDIDPKKATGSREEVLKYTAKHNIPVAGMHIAFPGMGRIKSNSESGYIFIPFE